MCREFIARSTKMPRSIGRLSASALLHHGLSSVVFIINIAESNFRHTQDLADPARGCNRPSPSSRWHQKLSAAGASTLPLGYVGAVDRIRPVGDQANRRPLDADRLVEHRAHLQWPLVEKNHYHQCDLARE